MLKLMGLGRTETYTVNGKEAPLLGMFVEKTKDLRDFATLSQGVLRWMKNACDYYGLNGNDSLYKKVALALSKSSKVAKRVFQGEVNEASSHQGLETLDQIKAKVKAEGSSIKTLSLNDADNDLMQLIVMACPNLEELRIRPRADCLMQTLTDAGLQLIPQLKQLKRLELNVWSCVSLTSASLTTILSDAGLQSRAVELRMMAPGVNDTMIPLIAKFTKLEHLTLTSCFLTTTGLSGLTLPAGLRELNLNQSTSMSVVAFNDTVLTRIAKCPSLTSLVIGGDNKISEEGVIAVLKALPNLRQLTWNDFPFSLKIMNHLPDGIHSLSIGDLSGLFYINGLQDFLKRAKALVSLSIQNTDPMSAFGSEDLDGYLPSTLKHLNLSTSGLSTLTFLPSMLETLTIQGSTLITPSQFKEVSKLSLTTLRLINCPTLNDEAFHHLMQGPLIETMHTFEVYNATISHKSVPLFTQIPKLHTLMIGQCYNIGIEGLKDLLKSPNLRERITRLFLDTPIIHEDMIELFNYFKNLKVLFIGNMLEYPLTQKAQEKIMNVRSVKSKNGVAVSWYGEMTTQAFNQAI